MNRDPDISHSEDGVSMIDAPEICTVEDYNDFAAKQRASVLWLLSKAYMPKIPSELYEPCYTDHEGNDRLKPQIIHSLANAELYCLALANIYADPNYHNLNHHGILQVLMRKGIEVVEPPDATLTETVLVQTAPIRMSAHMAVIEGIMALFIKEVLIPEKVMEVVSRYAVVNPESELPYDSEEAALLWINKSCIKMRHRIEEELGTCRTPDDPESSPIRKPSAPMISLAQDLGDLSDGCCLATVLSLYCPKYFKWQDIRLHDPISLADSVHNLQLVQRFCQDHLPQDIYCLTLEDMVYLHPSILQNLLTLVADLMYIFEIRPPKYICRPGVREETTSKISEAFSYVNHNGQRQSPLPNVRLRNFQQSVSPIPDLRSGAYGQGDVGRISPRSNGTWQKPQKSSSARKISVPDEKKIEGLRSLRRTHSMNFTEISRHGEKYGEPVPLQSSVLPTSQQRYHPEEDEELAGYFSPPQYHSSQQNLLEQDSNRRTRLSHSNEQIPLPTQSHYQVFHSANPLGNDASPGHLEVLKEQNETSSGKWAEARDAEPKQSIKRSPSSYEIHQLSPSKQDVGKEQGYARQRSQSEVDIPYNKKQEYSNYLNKQNLENASFKQYEEQFSEQTTPRETDSRRNRNSFHETPRHGTLRESDKHKKFNSPRRNNSDFYLHDRVDVESRNSNLSGSQTWRKPKDLFSRTEWNKENVDSESSFCLESNDNDQANTMSFANMSKQRNSSGSAINIIYTQQERDMQSGAHKKPVRPGYLHINPAQTSIPNSSPTSCHSKTPDWVQDNDVTLQTEAIDASVAAQMLDIRLKLEEKRKRIEQEKLRLESMSKKQREKVGKAAFLQAVRSSNASTNKDDASSKIEHRNRGNGKHFSIDDITEDLDSVRRKWLEKKTAEQDEDSDFEDKENYSHPEDFQMSIEQLNTSLTDLQSDISRLTQQQDQIQKMLRGSNKTPSQSEQHSYFLHDQNTLPQNDASKWAESVQHPNQIYPQQMEMPPHEIPHVGRGHWGQPVMPFTNFQSNQHLHNPPTWQPSASMYPSRPPSVEPQMMSGQPLNMQAHMYDRPPSTVPFPGVAQHGFSLHPQQQVQQPNFGMQMHPPNNYQNEPPGNYYQGQYPYPMYQQPSYNVVQNTFSMGMPENQNQNQGFHLHRSPSLNYDGSQLHNIQSPNQRNAPQKTPPPQMEPLHVRKSQSRTDFSYSPQEDVANVAMDDFGRPVKGNTMQHSPPNRPVLGKTFRVPKPKVVSPSFPNPTQDSPIAQISKQEQIRETQSAMSPPSQPTVDKGFYISFEETDLPRKPKPKLKPKHLKARNQQKKVDNETKRFESESNGDYSKDNQYSSTSNPVPVTPREAWKSDSRDSNQGGSCVNDRRERASQQSEERETDEKDSQEMSSSPGVGFIIGPELVDSDPDKEIEMTRRKEMIMMMSLRRRAEQEAKRNEKQQEYLRKREEERVKKEEQDRKKEDERLRRQLILEQYRQRKAADEEDGNPGGGGREDRPANKGATITRPKSRSTSVTRSKPKGGQSSASRHHDMSSPSSLDSPMGRGSQYNLSGGYQDDVSSEHSYTPSPRRSQTYPHSSPISPTSYPSSPGPFPIGMLGGGGRSRGTPSDGLSDTSSTISSAWASEYSGPKLFVKPSTKSNRGIITNAVNTVLAGAVNSETKRKVLEEMDRSDGKHFLILFRDAGCQFRALYSYNPETEEVFKIYGIGPRIVTDKMMDRFYKYNSGGKSFTQIHTKHLTATIDAFTIQSSLWQGKRATPLKRDYL